MNLVASLIRAVETTPARPANAAGVDLLVGVRRRSLIEAPDSNANFARMMAQHPIAEHTDTANEQHYELPPRFFELTLGPSANTAAACSHGDETLAQAEDAALDATIDHAALADGQSILELGCGWGSLSLTMAARFPQSRITAVSNSTPQRLFIEGKRGPGLTNLRVITCDMNDFQPDTRFDRIVSVEMFEHMANWQDLLERARGWLLPDGRLFLHVFSHRSQPYRFDTADKTDWIAQHFFTGGIMPSHGLIDHFPQSFTVEQSWRWDGRHYQRTADLWLKNFDANRAAIDEQLRQVYGDKAALWGRRWRLFYLATAGLFGHAQGREWGVSHYRLRPAP
jgi:cyclopropane-fatty-acyl-phospholipid synthase